MSDVPSWTSPARLAVHPCASRISPSFRREHRPSLPPAHALPWPGSGRAATVPWSSAPLADPESAVPHPPFPVTGRNHFPQAEDGDLPSTPEKSFTGRGGPGEGDAFSKAPSSPGKPPKLPLQKTRLPLPHPRCHLPGRARPGAHRPRRGQASATARAGAP